MEQYCTDCGAPIEENGSCPKCEMTQQVAASSEPEQSSQAKTYLNQGKQVSKNYWHHVVNTVKFPTQQAETSSGVGFVNGIITILLFCLFIPLSIFVFLKGTVGGFMGASISFSNVVIQPFFYLLLLMAVCVGVLFGVVKPGHSELSIQSVVARFGSWMIAPTVLVVLAFVCSILTMYTLVSYLALLGIAGIFISATLTIYSYRTPSSKLDPLYAALIFHIAFFIVFRILSEELMINSMLNPFGL